MKIVRRGILFIIVFLLLTAGIRPVDAKHYTIDHGPLKLAQVDAGGLSPTSTPSLSPSPVSSESPTPSKAPTPSLSPSPEASPSPSTTEAPTPSPTVPDNSDESLTVITPTPTSFSFLRLLRPRVTPAIQSTQAAVASAYNPTPKPPAGLSDIIAHPSYYTGQKYTPLLTVMLLFLAGISFIGGGSLITRPPEIWRKVRSRLIYRSDKSAATYGI